MENENENPDVSPEISIVIPLFNEEDSLYELIKWINEAMAEFSRSHEIICVDDGSTDNSLTVLETLYNENKNIQVISFQKNFGKSAALAVGFSHVRGRYVITLDADLQDDPHEIPMLVERLEEGYDLVSGWKKKRRDPLTKRIPSFIFNKITSLVSGIPIHDFNCGLKAYRREVTDYLDVYGELHRYLPFLAGRAGFRVTELPVQHHPRKFGRSKYGFWRFFSGFFDLLTVLILTRFTTRPLHFFGSIGILLVFLGMIINTYMLVLRINYGNIQGQQPLFMGGILFTITGVQFFFTGLLAEIITSFRKDRQDRYVIRKYLD